MKHFIRKSIVRLQVLVLLDNEACNQIVQWRHNFQDERVHQRSYLTFRLICRIIYPEQRFMVLVCWDENFAHYSPKEIECDYLTFNCS